MLKNPVIAQPDLYGADDGTEVVLREKKKDSEPRVWTSLHTSATNLLRI